MKVTATTQAIFLLILIPSLKGSHNSRNHENNVQKPNVVLILTDDQDTELGSLEAMPKLKKLITESGTSFPNMIVTTPICCCSRSTIFSGRYVHSNKAYNNSVSGGCNSEYWRSKIEPTAFPVLMKGAGYKTFYSGKYLNQYGYPNAGGPEHIPPGWDWWAGLIGQTYFFNYPMSINGTKVHFGTGYEDYLTNVIRSHAKDFLKTVDKSSPFFMVLAATAPHTPADSVPPYMHKFENKEAPRTPHYRKYAPDKHWVIRNLPQNLSEYLITGIDDLFRKRWRSLQSIDDMIEEVYFNLRKMGALDNTYIIYTSDNGFQLGQFNLPWDKRHLYEFDIHVPLSVRGPGVVQNQTRFEPVLNLDLAPTILSMAGIPVPTYMEGMSFKPLLKSNSPSLPWRQSFLVEYHGEKDAHRTCDPQLGCCITLCTCVDSTNNTYSCVRTVSRDHTNDIYCEFKDRENFIEYYDLNKDKYQLTNQAKSLTPMAMRSFKKRLVELKTCTGKQCRLF